MERRTKLTEIDIVRGIAIIGVLMVHSTSYAITKMIGDNLYGAYNFLNIFFKIGTTSFIFLSSFVLFYNYYPKPLTIARFTKFYRNRLMYIIVPYLLFSALYFLIQWKQGGSAWDVQRMLSSFGNKILTGKAYTHLYFVFISIQLYVLFPIVLFLFQRFRWLAASAIVLGIGLQWGFFLLNREYWQVPTRGSWSITYFGQYFLGAWLGIYFDRVKSWLIITKDKVTRSRIVLWIVLWGAWLASGITYVSTFYQARAYKTVFHNARYDALWDIYTMLTPIVLIQVAFFISRGIQSPFWIRGLRHLGIISFGVYLFHPLVLFVYRKFPLHGGKPLDYHLWYAGGFVSTLIISWVVVTVLSRLTGWSWVLFGSVPAQLRAADATKVDPVTQKAPTVSL